MSAASPERVLYHGDRTRSLRVRWCLEELELPYRLEPVLFPARIRQPEFQAENPLGSLPLFVEGDIRLTESMAICEYLVEKNGPSSMAVSGDEAGYPAYRQFCWYGEASLMPPLGTLVGYELLTPPNERPAKVVEDARALFARRLTAVERALSEAEYLAAQRFTLADVSVGYALGLAEGLGQSHQYSEAVVRYRERLSSRAAYQRASAINNTP